MKVLKSKGAAYCFAGAYVTAALFTILNFPGWFIMHIILLNLKPSFDKALKRMK